MVIHSLKNHEKLPYHRRRAIFLMAAICGWSLLLLARLFDLQVNQHERLVARGDDQRTAVIPLVAKRGDIHARDGQKLATSIDLGSIFAHPHLLPDRIAAAARLAPILGLREDDLLRELNPQRRFVYLRRAARPEMVAAVRDVVKANGWHQGIGIHQESTRYYPNRTLAAHVLGFVNRDNVGQAGVERYYDERIRGEPGRLNTLRDGWDRIIAGSGLGRTDPSRGRDIHLTIDWTLQFAAERALKDAVTKHRAVSGSIVALDPGTGEIVAMASYPTFNPNSRDEALLRNMRNHAVQTPLEPGSAFKVITAAAALHENVVSEDEIIDCQGGRLQVANHIYKDWRFGFGLLRFREVLMNSSNVGTIKVCLRLSPETYFQWVRDFGFGERTGVDLPFETIGLLQDPEGWSALSQSSMAFGQGISATPLQLASAVAAIANGGLLMRPYVVTHASSAQDNETVINEPLARRRVLKESIATRTALIMEDVVRAGTGKPTAIPGYRVAGKTSTAQKIDPATGRYTKYVAGFVGFLPVSAPRILILVMIDEPTRGYGHGGSQAAAPAFREVALAAIRKLRIQPDDFGADEFGNRSASPARSMPADAVGTAIAAPGM